MLNGTGGLNCGGYKHSNATGHRMPTSPGAGWIFSPIRPLFFENKQEQTKRREGFLEKRKLYPKKLCQFSGSPQNCASRSGVRVAESTRLTYQFFRLKRKELDRAFRPCTRARALLQKSPTSHATEKSSPSVSTQSIRPVLVSGRQNGHRNPLGCS